jgi:ribosomal protein S18 acetylase RimI-like enzyme
MSVSESAPSTNQETILQDVSLRNSLPTDIPSLVSLHQKAFPTSFLTMLGPRFLAELYRGFVCGDSGVCIVAESSKQLIGAVAGTTQPAGFFRSLLVQRWPHFVWAAIGSITARPWVVGTRLIGALFYRGENPEQLTGSGALLSSIGVDPTRSRGGVGRMLVDQFFELAKVAGADYVFLTTDKDDNDTVNRFYVRYGFTLEATFVKNGNRRMNRYIKPIERKSL